jgi:Tfp pilus assembly protein PilO
VKLVDLRQGNVPAAKTANALYVGIPFTVGVQGSYTHVMAFLGHLESGRYFCRFNSVGLASNSSDGTSGAMSLSLSIELLGTP